MLALTGGKTGGHIMPLLSLAKESNNNIIYVGGIGLLEDKLCKREKIPFIGLRLNNSNFKTILKAYFQLRKKLTYKISAIISTGGYISVPLLLYGVFNRIPIYLLEGNVILGSSNKLFSFFSRKVFLAYPIKNNKKKYHIVGSPIFKSDINLEKYSKYNIDILIIGGSLGSKPLCKLASKLSEKYNVCLVCGRYIKDYYSDKYVCFEYVDDMLSLMASSKVIISRSGAATTSEIFYLNKPNILVPSMKTKKNHQYLNAKYFEEKKYSLVILEEDLDNDIFHYIDLLLNSESVRVNILENQKKLNIENSAKRIMEEILK